MMSQEGHLASTSLLAGLEALAKINYDKPGTIYSTLFLLATGFERTMKIAVILDHKIRNDLANPTARQLRAFGHSLEHLYATLRNVAEARPILGWFGAGTSHAELLSVLSEFALVSRYHNTDQLGGRRNDSDPLTRWFAVHMKVANESISNNRLIGIMQRTRSYCEDKGLFGWEMGPKGEFDLTIDVTFELELARLSRGHFVWAVIETLKPIYELISRLTNKAQDLEKQQGLEHPTVPHMTEFFPFCLADKSTAIRRKAWTTLFQIAGRV